MKNTIKYFMTAGVMACLSFTACQTNDDSHDFDNKVFITADQFNEQVLVQTDEGVTVLTTGFQVGLAEPESQDVEVSFRSAPDLLDKYRLAYYDEAAELLPEGHCNAPQLNTVIAAGNMVSDYLQFEFTGLDRLDYSRNYVYPVTIESTSGIGVLESAGTMYFVIREASLINVVADLKDNCAWPDWENFTEVQDMETFTMEALVKPTAFNNSSSVHTIMGIEDHFLIRVGDVTIPKNQLQVATCRIDTENNTSFRESVSNSTMALNLDRWYHIAVTFDHGVTNVYIDGKLKGTGDFSGGNIQMTSANFMVKHSDESNNKPRCFWIGYSYDNNRSWDGSISEVRIWNRALTEEEINAPNHFYKIKTDDPQQTAGLVAYWKFNEGSGNVIKDYSGYGNDLSTASSVVWKNVSLPEK